MYQEKPASGSSSKVEAYFRWPFCSELYDPLAFDGLRTQRYVESLITFGELDTFDYFEASKGRASKCHSQIADLDN